MKRKDGKCQARLVTQYNCQRKAVTVRVTSKGIEVALCSKCNESFGHIVGNVKIGKCKRCGGEVTQSANYIGCKTCGAEHNTSGEEV